MCAYPYNFFPSMEGNGVIKNCVTRLIRRRKLIGVTQMFIQPSFACMVFQKNHELTKQPIKFKKILFCQNNNCFVLIYLDR